MHKEIRFVKCKKCKKHVDYDLVRDNIYECHECKRKLKIWNIRKLIKKDRNRKLNMEALRFGVTGDKK